MSRIAWLTPQPPTHALIGTKSYSLQYPPDFHLVVNGDGQVWRNLELLDYVEVSKLDRNQKAYRVISSMPSFEEDRIYPTYTVTIYVIKQTSEARFFSASAGIYHGYDKKYTAAGHEATRYTTGSKAGPDPVLDPGFYKVATVVPVNGYDYIIEYSGNGNPLGTRDKYLDVYDQIIATIKFTFPSAQMPSQAASQLMSPTPVN